MLKLFKKKDITPVAERRSVLKIDRKTIIIHHYCPHTYNAGDHFVIRSIRNSLSRRIPGAVFIPKASSRNRGWGKPLRLTGENIEFSNRRADAIIAGGSDLYNGWSLRLKADELAELSPKLFLIGLGASSKNLYSEPHIPKKEFYRDIRESHKYIEMSSVRDFATYNFLKKLGVEKQIVTGCPALYLFDEPFALTDSETVALTFPFPVIKRKARGKFDRLTELISKLIKHYETKGLKPLIVCHDDRDLSSAQELFPNKRMFFSNYFQDYFDVYRNAAFIVGSRLHASIIGAALGKPFVNINLDMRGKAFSEMFDLSDWNVDVDDEDIFEKAKSRGDKILSSDLSVFEKFYAKKSEYREIYEKFMDGVAGKIIESLRSAK